MNSGVTSRTASRLTPPLSPAPLRAVAAWLVSQSPWLCASLVALVLSCVRDLVYPLRAVPFRFLGYYAALVLPLALVHGVLFSAALWLGARLPRWASVLGWCLAAGFGSGSLARVLGGFTRLHSRYAKLAIMVLVACSVAAVAFGWLLLVLQPTAAEPRGYLPSKSPRVRWVFALLLLGSCVGLHVADLRVFPNQYPAAHLAFRLSSFWLLMIALVLAWPEWPRLHKLVWLVAALSFGGCLWLLDERRTVTLNEFVVHPWARGVLQLSRELVDFDRDGHASLLGASDCEPWNPRVHPGAHEIPDNGIDENCVLGDAKRLNQKIVLPPDPPEPAPMDVVLITVDALNPDHLGLYNPKDYGPEARNTTPQLDAWSRNATVFDRAYTSGGWTSIAVPSLLRGLYPRHLAWRKFFETNRFAIVPAGQQQLAPGEERLHMFPLAFGDPHPTMAEFAKRRGMTTMAVTDDGYSAMLERGTGIERGFDAYHQIDHLPENKRNDAGTADMAIQLLQMVSHEKRFFMWVHFFGTHWPDEVHPELKSYGTRPVDVYDHQVAYLDTQLIRLLDEIAKRPTPTAVFVTADHGEGINPISRYHGDTLDEPVIRIPLLARVPGWPAGRIRRAVSCVDLVPSVLGILQSPKPDYLDGIDLGPLAQRKSDTPGRQIFSDAWRYSPWEKLELDLSAVFDGTRKFILDRKAGALYYESQVEPAQLGFIQSPAKLVGSAPFDSLSGAVFAYFEETGILAFTE